MESATTAFPAENSRRAPTSAVLGAALLLVTFLAYSNTWQVPFLLDDNASIIENASIRDLSRLDAVFWPPSSSGTGGRPFANFTFALNYAWGELRVGGYHAVNLVVHLTAALLLFGLIRRTLELPRFRDRFLPANTRAIAFGAALLWAVHPLHTESVTYIAQRTESLMATLYLATLYAYVRGVFESRGWFVVALVTCILGMATKEVMVTAPVVVLLYDRVFIAGSFREVWQSRRGRLLGLAATWIPLVFFLADVSGLGLVLATATFVRNHTYATALSLWTDTAQKAPTNARAFAALGAAQLEKGDLAPAIVSLERALKLDPRFAEAHNNLATALVDANRLNEAVEHFTLALKLRPGTASTHYNFGNTLLALGRPAEAISQQEQALILQPKFAEASCALGNALFAAGRYEPAIKRFREALLLQPNLVPAHYGLANALAQIGLGAQAIAHYEATLRAVPNSVEARYNFANVLFSLQRYGEAAGHYEATLKYQPDFADAHNNLANALALTGRADEAIPHYEQAVKLRPDYAAAQKNLEALRKAREKQK